jgi:hypothetical protein
MNELKTKTVLQRRLTNFVNWIKPDTDERDLIKDRADNIRKNVIKNAEEDGIIVVSTPAAGSFASHTGLRRHYRGESEVDGQDIDLPFIIEPETVEGEELNELLRRFEEYINVTYSDTEKKKTKSSIKLMFSDNINFDIIPMLFNADEEQIIIRSNGDEIKTSVQKHVRFIKTRNSISSREDGRVKLNQCIRLLKWWKEFQAGNSFYFRDDPPPSFLISLLAAKAFDKLSVSESYAETLARWFGYLAHLIKSKELILFYDFNEPQNRSADTWCVIDPVNESNNITKDWNQGKINELAEWFEIGRDIWNRVIHFDEDEDDSKSLDLLVQLFGNPFKNHC